MDKPIYECTLWYDDGRYDWGGFTLIMGDKDHNQSEFIFKRPMKQLDGMLGTMRTYCPKDLSSSMQFLLYGEPSTLKIYAGAVSGYKVEVYTPNKTSPWAIIICGEWTNKEKYLNEINNSSGEHND